MRKLILIGVIRMRFGEITSDQKKKVVIHKLWFPGMLKVQYHLNVLTIQNVEEYKG